MNLIFQPLEHWTDPETSDRKPGSFTSTWTDTLQLLDREIDMLVSNNRSHTEVVIQVAAPRSAMRLDGGLRADAKVTHPGVIISFEGPKGPMRFVCDRFKGNSRYVGGRWVNTPDWQMNVRAIAKGLEALRMIDRYGIAQSGEQYQGWAQLGSGIAMPAAGLQTMTVQEAALYLAEHGAPQLFEHGGWMNLANSAYETERKNAFRVASRSLHPDTGGSTEAFQKLQEAKRVLDEASS